MFPALHPGSPAPKQAKDSVPAQVAGLQVAVLPLATGSAQVIRLAERSAPAVRRHAPTGRPAVLAFRTGAVAPMPQALSQPSSLSQPAAATGHGCPPSALDDGPDDGTQTARCLTTSDRMALVAWHHGGAGGYARMVLEQGTSGASPDQGGYVLLYKGSSPWATWGLTRRAAGILAWRCCNGAALGTFPTMQAALDALPRVIHTPGVRALLPPRS